MKKTVQDYFGNSTCKIANTKMSVSFFTDMLALSQQTNLLHDKAPRANNSKALKKRAS